MEIDSVEPSDRGRRRCGGPRCGRRGGRGAFRARCPGRRARRGCRRGRRPGGRCGCSRCRVVGVDAVVVGQLQDAGPRRQAQKTLIASSPIGIRRRLLEAELLVEGDRAIDLADPVAGVEEARHRLGARGYRRACELAPAGRNGPAAASIQFSAMARRTTARRRTPRSGRRSSWSRSGSSSPRSRSPAASPRPGRSTSTTRRRRSPPCKPVQKGRSSAIYAADGSLIGFIRSSNIRQPVPGERCPQTLKDATVAIEDRNFFEHGAIDADGDRARRLEEHPGRRQAGRRAPRRSPSSWSATSTSSTPNRRSSES